jgi:zinc transport system ATP-binding protein
MPSDPGDALLRCDGLVIGHRGRPLLPPIDATIHRGTTVAVLGRNGSGKSTLFQTLLGFLPAVAGAVHHVHRAPRMAYMAQASTVDPLVPLRAREVAAWGTLTGWGFLRGASRGQIRRRAESALQAVQALELADAFVRDLSEGQRQRVLLARVLATSADLAFLDEPTAAMDAVAEQRTMTLLREQTRERGMSVVIITHLLGLVRRFADRVLYLDRDDGLAMYDVPDAIFAHPTFRRQYGEIG